MSFTTSTNAARKPFVKICAAPLAGNALVHRARTSSGAPLTCATNPPSAGSTVVIRFRCGSNRNNRARCASRVSASSRTPTECAKFSKASSIGSPDSVRSSAVVHRASAAANSARGVAWTPDPSRASTTLMALRVKVPVLSVQMTSVEPNVSTADKRLTSAPRLAMPRTPAARASVIVGSNPSGTLATSSPMANKNACVQVKPASTPSGRNATATPVATAAINHATRRTWRSSGLSARRTRADNAAMRPSSVCLPVACTTASADPPVHTVPLKINSGDESSGR